MKTYKILALAALTLGFASCATEDAVEQVSNSSLQPLEFTSYLGTESRATHVESNPSKGYDFKKTGFTLYANVKQGSTGEVKPFMNNQKITFDETANKWVYAPVKYWPTEAGSTLDFYPRYTGWTEASATAAGVEDLGRNDSVNIVSTYDWNNIPQVTFYVNDVVSKQTDYIWAAPIFGAKSSDYTNGKVSFQFKHALSAFTFFLKVKGLNSEVDSVVVNSVTVNGYFAPKAELNPDATDIANIWNLQGDWAKRSYTISREGDNEIYTDTVYNSNEFLPITKLGSSSVEEGGVKKYGKGTIMVLPFNNTSYTITLDYDIITYPSAADKEAKTNGVRENYTASKEVTGVELKPGYIYNNKITLKMQAIEVSASVSPWSNTNQSVSIND